MKSLFGNKIGSSRTDQSTSSIVLESLSGQTAGRANFIDTKVATSAIAMEGFNDAMSVDIEGAVTSLQSLIQGAVKSAKLGTLNIAQEDAAVLGGLAGTVPKAYYSRSVPTAQNLKQAFAGVKNGTLTHVIDNDSDSADRVAMEAFDERVNRNAMSYSVAYNLQASRQSEFGEAFFPTVVVTPDNVGFTISVRLLYAYSEVSRSTSGALNNFNRQNIIRAVIDPTILQVDQTKLIPVYRLSSPAAPATDSAQNFVAGITATTLMVDGQPLQTAPLAIGASFSILGISQTNAALAAGTQDQTDAVDSSVRLNTVVVKLTGTGANSGVTEFFSIDVSMLPGSDFNAAPQGNTRLLQLNFTTKTLLMTSTMTQADGSASVLLPALSTNTARLGVSVYGSIVQDLGDTTTSASATTVTAVNDASGNSLSTASGAGATVAATLATASVVGYTLTAYRTNSNRRNRGKMIDIQNVNYLYTVPLLSPLTALRPVGDTDANDGNLLSNLITATRMQTSTAAVTALLKAESELQAYASAGDSVTNQLKMFGAASELVTPAYSPLSIDAATAVDSLTSSERAADLQALLMNKIRDMATRLFVKSGYGPASEAMYEGAPPKPVVVIGCDPIIYRYLTLTGDLRLMGDMFDYKIVMCYDQRMVGRLIFSFGQESSFNSGVPNPLHFGNMGWKPEVTIMMPMVRNGANVMELTVQPSFRHVVNLPIMGSLTITNLDVVIGSKVAVNNHPV